MEGEGEGEGEAEGEGSKFRRSTEQAKEDKIIL
jgi:hypothetical protein